MFKAREVELGDILQSNEFITGSRNGSTPRIEGSVHIDPWWYHHREVEVRTKQSIITDFSRTKANYVVERICVEQPPWWERGDAFEPRAYCRRLDAQGKYDSTSESINFFLSCIRDQWISVQLVGKMEVLP